MFGLSASVLCRDGFCVFEGAGDLIVESREDTWGAGASVEQLADVLTAAAAWVLGANPGQPVSAEKQLSSVCVSMQHVCTAMERVVFLAVVA